MPLIEEIWIVENGFEIDHGYDLASDKREDVLFELTRFCIGHFAGRILAHMKPVFLGRRFSFLDLFERSEHPPHPLAFRIYLQGRGRLRFTAHLWMDDVSEWRKFGNFTLPTHHPFDRAAISHVDHLIRFS